MDERLLIRQAEQFYPLENCKITRVPGHDGGRNTIFIITSNDGKKTVLRVSELPDRTEVDYLAETAFVHFLAQNGAPVADVLPSTNTGTYDVISLHPKRRFIVYECFCYPISRLQRQL